MVVNSWSSSLQLAALGSNTALIAWCLTWLFQRFALKGRWMERKNLLTLLPSVQCKLKPLKVDKTFVASICNIGFVSHVESPCSHHRFQYICLRELCRFEEHDTSWYKLWLLDRLCALLFPQKYMSYLKMQFAWRVYASCRLPSYIIS